MNIKIKSPFPSDMPEDEKAKALEQLLESPTTQAEREVKASQEAVAMFAEYQKKQLFEQQLIGVATPLLAAMIRNQGIAFAVSLIAKVDIEMSTPEKMIDKAIEIAIDLIKEISETVND